ncbi:MAG: PSD1 and planctomycete cytochrome C domain-containing protein [Verrucomicrobiales bacterium]
MKRLFATVTAILCAGNSTRAEVRYNRDILPILAGKCLACHGADTAKRKAKLRLDDRESACAERDGVRAIVPGKPGESALISRIFSNEEDEVMPPVDEKDKQLTAQEKQILKEWIVQGANYQRHWAFEPPSKPVVPAADSWGHNEIDRFVLVRLRARGLQPQKQAGKERLIRRASIDLTGLPPTIEEVEAFLADNAEQAYEELVERLLASPRFGERMASWWLDGARYGDSHGYDNDLENAQWPWRNWVIESFNLNKPFDEFAIEQLAGDLLPNASEDQILATGFNRNHRIQTEGGAIDEEWRTEYVIDRVETMGAVFLGLTLNCARCHDHKYDPISQKEFYQMFSLFNNLDEKGFIDNLRGSAAPSIRYKQGKYNERVQEINERVQDKKARQREIGQLSDNHPHVMIMRDEKPRKAYILNRGQYDAPGEQVHPGLPQAFSPVPGGDKITRLDLAKWLVDGKHPLTARVAVNRLWEQLFGTGIVKSSENFGVQADWPSHPGLLDWLAVDFMESGWNVKHLLKKMVLSATYQQSAIVDALRLARDPENRFLSRGPRTRLQAEMIRDQALMLSGLLVAKLGGPSWWVYQPDGLWEEVEKRGKFVQDHGEKLYRRTLYSRIRRTVAPPSMRLFDQPSREFCTVKRMQTNTPLQALALMNEVTYVEASKKFAERMMMKGRNAKERIAWGWRSATARVATEQELEILLGGYERRLALYREDSRSAEELLGQGESKVAGHLPEAELAALTTVANVILNLDEVINK